MYIIQKPSEWFKSEDAVKQFHASPSIAEKSLLLCSYLITVTNESFSKNTLYAVSFFLADNLGNNDFPYDNYKSMIDADKNPYIAYLKNCKGFVSFDHLFVVFIAILQNKANAFDKNDWIYRLNLKKKDVLEILPDNNCAYIPELSEIMPIANPKSFEIKESLQMAELELYWLFRMGVLE